MASKLRPFTLIETLLVLSLVALAAGLIGVRGVRALSNRRFESSVDALLVRLSLAQELMVCCDADITVHLAPDKLTLTSAQPLPGFEHAFKTLKLSNIACLSHQTLRFPAHARHAISCGNLEITGSRGQHATIGLPGFPTKITRTPIQEHPYETPPLSIA
jgi:hypothetical protein